MNRIVKSPPYNHLTLDRREILLTGAHAKPGRYAKPAPTPRRVLDIGKLLSLQLTFEQYGITPNAVLARELGE